MRKEYDKEVFDFVFFFASKNEVKTFNDLQE